jgi:hypothetical protein
MLRSPVLMLLSNRCWGVKHIISKEALPGAWLSSRSTLAAA